MQLLPKLFYRRHKGAAKGVFSFSEQLRGRGGEKRSEERAFAAPHFACQRAKLIKICYHQAILYEEHALKRAGAVFLCWEEQQMLIPRQFKRKPHTQWAFHLIKIRRRALSAASAESSKKRILRLFVLTPSGNQRARNNFAAVSFS